MVKVVGVCPDCGKDLVKRSGRYGDFVGCKVFLNVDLPVL